jgi:FAD/FMN-containing dehydrogenase
LPGKVLLPAQDGWDKARRPWQLHVDQRPAAVICPEIASDVASAVGFAAQRGLRVIAQGTGHNASALGGLEDVILIKTERMRRVVIDAGARVARVEAGVLAAELAEAAARHGLVAVSGSSPDVGVVGYTIGGGIGVLSRGFGLASDRVRAIELVTADGRIMRADREHESDLFWAVRGGGGSFGIVTALELELLPLRHAYAGTLWYPRERAGEVLHTWRELTEADPPVELSTMGRLLSFPPTPDVPQPLRGKSFALVHVYHAGDPEQADRLLAPLRALKPITDALQTAAVPALSGVHMDPDRPVPAVGDGLMLAKLPSEAIDGLLEAVGPQLATLELRHLEGELARDHSGSGALSSIPAKHAVFMGGFGPTPDLAAAIEEQIEAVKQSLAPWTTPYMHLNFADSQRAPGSFWTEDAYRRLRRIKAAVDPADLILANHPVAPEG